MVERISVVAFEQLEAQEERHESTQFLPFIRMVGELGTDTMIHIL